MFQHLEGASILRTELALGLSGKRVGGMVEKVEPHPITHGELQLILMLVVVALGIRLRLKKTFADLCKEGVTITKQRVHGLRLSCPSSMGQQGRGRLTIYNLLKNARGPSLGEEQC
jgi:hypothetical protein